MKAVILAQLCVRRCRSHQLDVSNDPRYFVIAVTNGIIKVEDRAFLSVATVGR